MLCELPARGDPGYDPAVDAAGSDDEEVASSVFRVNARGPNESGRYVHCSVC